MAGDCALLRIFLVTLFDCLRIRFWLCFLSFIFRFFSPSPKDEGEKEKGVSH